MFQRKIRRLFHVFHRGISLAKRLIREEILNRLKVKCLKPYVINFLVTDVCNSRCQMCFIWKNKYQNEIDVNEFSNILHDPLFSEIRHIGVTGGEPTIRPELPAFFSAACNALPSLTGMSLITNALSPDIAAERILASREICLRHGKTFSVMVSMDGVGEVHDVSRGRVGNFEKAVNLIHKLQENGINPTIACTITKSNCLHVDELLDWSIENGVYARFRIGEFINRLGNEDSDVIRVFDRYEIYHLTLFFMRLIESYEESKSIKKTYSNIISMLSENKTRQIGCPYQDRGVVLTARNEILYCAPKSPIIGDLRNNSENSAWEIYKKNIHVRDKILSDYCGSCIHDYHVPYSAREELKDYAASLIRKHSRFSLDRQLRKRLQ